MSTPFIFSYPSQWVSPSSITAVTEDSDAPASNALVKHQPYRVFRGTGAFGSENLVIDFGATQTLNGVFIDNINSAGIEVQGNGTDSWGSPSYDPGDEAVAYSKISGRYKIFWDLRSTTFASTGYRYLRINNTAVSSTDGQNVLEVGALTFMQTISEWTQNTGFPYRWKARRGHQLLEKPSGGLDVSSLGGRYAEITLGSTLNTSDMDSDMESFADAAVGGSLVFFWRNNGTTNEAYLARRPFTGEYSIDSAVTRTFTPLVMREVT